MIRQNDEGKGYYFNIEGKRSVPKEIFLYGLLKLKEVEGDNTMALETIQEKIGLAFCMQDYETVEMLKDLSKKYGKYLAYSEVAGVKQLQFIKDLKTQKVLDDYYGSSL